MGRADVIAGLSVAGILLPEAVAYSAIAGLPAERGVLAAVAGTLAYAAVGQSRFAIVAPTSSSALILAATMASLTPDPALRADVATLAVALVGAALVAVALLGLGGLTNLVSRPVLRGFAFGLAVTIVLRQMPAVLGIGHEAGHTALWREAADIARRLPDAHWPSLLSAAAALAGYFALRPFRAVPAALVVLAAGIAASRVLGLSAQGVAVLGPLSFAPRPPVLPDLTAAQWSQLVQLSLPLVLIVLAESWGTVSALTLASGGPAPAPRREIGALGLANLAAALARGMPVGAGYSAGAAAASAGTATNATAAFAGLALAAILLAGSGLVAALPQPVIAAVVIGVVLPSLDPAPFLRLWRLGRDLSFALAAAGGVIAFGVLDGMLLALGLSLAGVIHRLAATPAARLGRLPGTRDYVDVARHPDAIAEADCPILRPSGPLFFGNAAPLLDRIRSDLAGLPPGADAILSLEETFDLDSTTLEALVGLDAALERQGVTLWLARVHDHVRDTLSAGGAAGLLARSTYSVDDAFRAAGERPEAG